MENLSIKSVVGYEGYYNITSEGRVYSLYGNRNKLLSCKVNTNEYPRIALSKDGIEKKHSIHRLVATAFIPNPENKPCVNHKNGIKTDYRIENLEWVTYKENLTHAQESNLMNYDKVRGENHTNSILTNKDVLEIKSMLKNGIGGSKIARIYGVAPQIICNIKKGRRWTAI